MLKSTEKSIAYMVIQWTFCILNGQKMEGFWLLVEWIIRLLYGMLPIFLVNIRIFKAIFALYSVLMRH